MNAMLGEQPDFNEDLSVLERDLRAEILKISKVVEGEVDVENTAGSGFFWKL